MNAIKTVDFDANKALIFHDFGHFESLDRLYSLRKKIRSRKGAANENFVRERRARAAFAAVSRSGKRVGILRKFPSRVESEAPFHLPFSRSREVKGVVGNAIVL